MIEYGKVTEKNTIPERLAALRNRMKEQGIHYYLVPTADYHQSEYVGEFFKERRFITGFTGSAGVAVIGEKEAYLWTDGRYFIQASAQLKDSTITLMKMGEPGVPSIPAFLEKELQEGQVLGFDGRTLSVAEGNRFLAIAEKNKASVRYNVDLVGEIWEDRPAISREPVFELGTEYAGESRENKIARVRAEMEKAGADYHILTTLDDICWLLNIRGNDVEFFPLVLSYLVLDQEELHLFIDETKLPSELKAHLQAAGVDFRPYDEINAYVVEDLQEQKTLMVDSQKLNYALYKDIPETIEIVKKRNPEILMKAIKNETEIANIRIAQRKDAVAHVKFMKWLKENVGKMKITEISASDKLDEFRKEQGNFLRPSFDPISSYGEHGAIVHYSATPETDVELKEGKFLLTDTGAGFWEGSTDVTRTFALGNVPDIMKEHFTIVAISNLNLAAAKFMEGCTGNNLDYIARKPFWDRGLNFNHGTGHGVGYLLNIHEGPAAFRWQIRPDEVEPLREGMIITDEPGLYIENSHGIRLENEVLVRKGERNEYGQFMYLETLTLIPFDLDAIKPEIMSEEDKRLLNAYHARVYEQLSPYLDEEEKAFLKKYTREVY